MKLRETGRAYGILALFVIFFAGAAGADDTGTGRTGASYLWLAPGARAAAMGGAFTAIADDANGAYYNPAGIAQSPRHELGLTSAVLGADRSYGYFSYAFAFVMEHKEDAFGRIERLSDPNSFFIPPQERVVGLGLSWLNAGVSGIGGRDDFGNPNGTLNDSENTYVLTAGYKQAESLYLGLNIKLHSQSLANATANGFGFDMGALYRPPASNLSVGLALQNAGDSLKWKVPDTVLLVDDEYSEPIQFRGKLGAAYRFSDRLLAALDLEYPSLYSLGYSAGAEYHLLPPFALRCGVNNTNPAFGFGLTVLETAFHVTLDYACIIDINALSNQHRFTVDARFGTTVKDKKKAARKRKRNRY